MNYGSSAYISNFTETYSSAFITVYLCWLSVAKGSWTPTVCTKDIIKRSSWQVAKLRSDHFLLLKLFQNISVRIANTTASLVWANCAYQLASSILQKQQLFSCFCTVEAQGCGRRTLLNVIAFILTTNHVSMSRLYYAYHTTLQRLEFVVIVAVA